MKIKMAEYYRNLIFQLRWTFMSPQKRYAYLWNRTKHSHYQF